MMNRNGKLKGGEGGNGTHVEISSIQVGEANFEGDSGGGRAHSRYRC